MKNKELSHPIIKKLRREKKFYLFWEIETTLGAIDVNNQAGTKKEKEEGEKIADQFFHELQTTFFRK
jgi:hypothetical protein